jgi:hypothetical protein
MPFDEDDLMAELEQAVADLKAFASAFTLPEGDVTETDLTGVVAATVTPGLAVRSIVVQPTWENVVEAGRLAACVDEALGRATSRAMGIDPDLAIDLDAEEAPSGPAPVTASDKAEARRTVADMERHLLDQAASIDRDPEAAATRLEQLVSQMESAIAATERAQAEGIPDGEPDRLYSANRMVSMASNGMSFLGTDININWLKGKSGSAVTQCLSEILEQAPQDQAAGFAQAIRTAFGEA